MSDVSRQMSESYFYLSRDDTSDAASFSPTSRVSDTTALMRLAGEFDKSTNEFARNKRFQDQISSQSTPLVSRHAKSTTLPNFGTERTHHEPTYDLESRLKPLLRQELNDFRTEMAAMIRNSNTIHNSEQPGALSTPIRGMPYSQNLPKRLPGLLPEPKANANASESPVTTPPNSHEFDTKGSFAPASSFGYPNVTSPSPAVNPHIPTTPMNSETELRAELARLKAENHQLQAKNVDLTLHVNELEFQLQHQQDIDITSSQIDLLEQPPRTQDTKQPITADLVPPEFRKHYHKLNLGAIDSIDDIELQNTLKNIMLTLLICDYDSLPQMCQKIAHYIKTTGEFMDKVHEHVYDVQGTLQPSSYLREDAPDSQARFQQCLQQMLEQITKHI